MNRTNQEQWREVAKLILKDNPRRYTVSEVESVLIGCKQFPELQEPLQAFLRLVKMNRR